MATRKPWESLSPSYRERLSKKGITPQMHSRGESIKAARGHAHTPERPGRLTGKKEFSDYENRRRSLIQKVNQRKARLWGDAHKFSREGSRKITDRGYNGEHPPSMEKLQWAIDATDEELEQAAFEQDDDDSFLWYH